MSQLSPESLKEILNVEKVLAEQINLEIEGYWTIKRGHQIIPRASRIFERSFRTITEK